jgi:trehalose synthase
VPGLVKISALDAERFRAVLPADRFQAFTYGLQEGRELLDGRVVWNVNSTAHGGGVVELLRPLVAYARGAGLDVRWTVIDGTSDFFAVTKRVHNRLHGAEGDGLPLDDDSRRTYESVLARNGEAIAELVNKGDVVILHDPQTAGMTERLRDAGAAVIWRCHVGLDRANDLARDAWQFLRPYVLDADAYVFSREAYAWEGLDASRVAVIAPSIDPFTPKNRELDDKTVLSVLRASAILADGREAEPVTFERQDGSRDRIGGQAELFEDEPLRADVPVVAQVSRWDALKDPVGVIRGFAEHVPAETSSHLVCAGPTVDAVADDPEGAQVLRESIAAREQLPAALRRRVHLASLPMRDLDENALIVNALQRHARVVVQKSLAEGFGLTVAEAMWKGRPVVGSRIGGIQDQITDGESGVLLAEPLDLAAFGDAVAGLLNDPQLAERIGRNARARVVDRFLSVRSLLDYLALIQKVFLTDAN